jgi:hypothetical protein
MGTDLNRFLREQVERLAGMQQRMSEHDAFEARCLQNGARLNGWQFSRDEATQRG